MYHTAMTQAMTQVASYTYTMGSYASDKKKHLHLNNIISHHKTNSKCTMLTKPVCGYLWQLWILPWTNNRAGYTTQRRLHYTEKACTTLTLHHTEKTVLLRGRLQSLRTLCTHLATNHSAKGLGTFHCFEARKLLMF